MTILAFDTPFEKDPKADFDVSSFLVLLMSCGTTAVELNRVWDWLIRMTTVYVTAYVQTCGNRIETCESV